MFFPLSRTVLWRLVNAGTLMTILGLGLTSARGDSESHDARKAERRYRKAVARGEAGPDRTYAISPEQANELDILQIIEQDMAVPLPPPEGAKTQPEGDGPPMGTNPIVAAEKAAEPPAEQAAEAPWELTNLFGDGSGGNWMKDNQFKLGGNIDQSWTGNFQSPSDRFNGPVTWTDRSNDYQLNQAWIYIERATDTTKQDFDIGGRFDAFWGSNARFDTESGLEVPRINGHYAFYGWALPQFYIETAYKNVKIKWGHFISPVGYFTVDMTQNFFNTLPYTFQYGEPFTHTGNVGTWTINPEWTVGWGVVRGWDNWNGAGSGSHNLNGIAMVTRTWEDKSSLYWFAIAGTNANGFGIDQSSRYLQTVTYSKPLSEQWNYVAQSDFGIQDNTNNAVGGGTSKWYGLNQYLYYTQNDNWQWGINFEWFRDEEGYRVGGFLPNLPSTPATVATRGLPTNRVGYVGNFFQTTFGPKWMITKNMFLRPNLRFDYFDGVATTGLLPYDNGNKHWQGILATDLAILY